MAREGLRTLVVAKKSLTEEQYLDFEVTSFTFYSYEFFHNTVFKRNGEIFSPYRL